MRNNTKRVRQPGTYAIGAIKIEREGTVERDTGIRICLGIARICCNTTETEQLFLSST